jgi:hypothetical protein
VFPSLWRRVDGTIVLAVDEVRGVVIFTPEGQRSWPVGYEFSPSSRPWVLANAYTQLTEPVTLTFNP